MMQITAQPDMQSWELFIARHPHGNIFQSPAMYALYRSINTYQPGVLALQDGKGHVKGILLYNIIHEPGKKKFFSYRSIIMGGPLVENDEEEAMLALLNAYVKKIRTTKAIYTQVRNLRVSDHWSVFKAAGFRYSDHLNVCIDLSKTEAQLIQDMHKKRYSNIKRAIKKNCVVKVPDANIDMNEVVRLMHKTYLRINMPRPPAELFLNATQYLKDQVILGAAYYDDIMIACRMYVLFNGTMYDWYAGSDLQYKHLLPNDLLPWESMQWGKANHMRVYDFAGAGNPQKPYGVREYKTRFGGELVNPGRYQAVHKPLLYWIGRAGMRLLKYEV
jgi:serine/alanine adding enzyme